MTDATMTKADLVEDVIKAAGLPRKEAEIIVETIFDSMIGRCRAATKSKSAASEAFARASAVGVSAAIPRPAKKWKCLPSASHFSSPARS